MKRYLSGLMCRWGVFHQWRPAPSTVVRGGTIPFGRVMISPEVCARCGAVRVVSWRVEIPGEMFSAPARPDDAAR